MHELGRWSDVSQRVLLLAKFSEAGDALGEWLASLTHHHTALLHQGAEWRGDFLSSYALHRQLADCCGRVSPSCIQAVLDRGGVKIDYLAIHRSSCPGLGELTRSTAAESFATAAFDVVPWDGSAHLDVEGQTASD